MKARTVKPGGVGQHVARLTDPQLELLVQIFHGANTTVGWVRDGDGYVAAGGYVTRPGRALARLGYIRLAGAGRVVWFPGVKGCGARRGDEPARVMEITPDGERAVREHMGENGYAQLVRLRDEHRERLARPIGEQVAR